MKFIETFREGMHVSDVYLCKTKQIALTKNGKEYGSLNLQDKTGTVDAKIWELNSPGINEFSAMDYVFVDADVTVFQGQFQLNVKRIRRADENEYRPSDYLPVTAKDVKTMHHELVQYITTIRNENLRKLAAGFFMNDAAFIKEFCRPFRGQKRPSQLCRRPFGAYLKRSQDVRLFLQAVSGAEPGSAFDRRDVP